MHVEEYGPESGTPIVFLHGSMVAGWMWEPQIEHLDTYRCIVVDLPGFGASGSQPWQSFADTADQVAGFIADTCGQSHVVGLSLGGLIGLHLTTRHPEVVSSLLVSGVPYGPIPAPLKVVGRLMAALYSRPRGAALVARGIGLNDDEAIELFVTTATQTHPDALATVTDEVERKPLPDGLAELRTPTLAVVGERDTKPAKRGAAHLNDVLPNGAAYTVSGVGHPWNAENPTLFTDMVRAWVDEGQIVDGLNPLD